MFFQRPQQWTKGGSYSKHPLSSLPNAPLFFFLLPYPLPLSMCATQAKQYPNSNLRNNMIMVFSVMAYTQDIYWIYFDSARKVMLNNLGLLDFAFTLVNSVLYMFNRQVKFFGVFKKLINGVINSAHQKCLFGLEHAALCYRSCKGHSLICNADFLYTLFNVEFCWNCCFSCLFSMYQAFQIHAFFVYSL